MRTLVRRFKAYRARNSDYQLSRAYKLSWAVVLIHHVIVILAGCVGFWVDPSPVVVAIVGGQVATYFWSGTFILFGCGALFARLMQRARAEAVSVVSIACARVLWAGILIYSIAKGISEPGGLQIALMLLAGAIFLFSWSLTVFIWMTGAPITGVAHTTTLTQLRDQLQEVVERPRDEEQE